MSKKSRRAKQLQRSLVLPRIFEQQMSHARHQILQGDFAGTIDTCEPMLSHLPRRSSTRVEVLALLGLAHGMLQHYEESYDLFTEAVTIDPTNAQLWYNRGLACRYTTRVGQAVRDFERAVALSEHDTGELARKFSQELTISRRHFQAAMEEQGVHSTLDEFIEREERFMQAMSLMRQSKLPLVIHVDQMPTLILGKTCRYCVNCDLLIAHQDQLEEQLAGYFSTYNPQATGNDYLVLGTLDRPEWRQGMQDSLSMQEMIEHLHDFKEVVTFEREYVHI